MNSPLKPIQTEFTCHTWRSPTGTFHHIFARLNLQCELESSPGLAIVTDQDCGKADAIAVKNLRKELPAILDKTAPARVVYWSSYRDEEKLAALLSQLTKTPVFFG